MNKTEAIGHTELSSRSAKISLRQLQMVYESRSRRMIALQDINLEVKEGEFVVFIGPSGCGKSTLLRVIAGLLKPTGGRMLIDGRPADKPGADRAVVFQDDSVFPWMTVEQNVEYGLKIRKIGKQERRIMVDKFLLMVGLSRPGIHNLLPKELSGGMKKRVDMARAIANNPEILLMDEPFGMLDAMTKEKLQLETIKIWEETKKTVCFVTHDLEEALFLADRIIVLGADPGHFHTEIEPAFARPRNLEVKMTAEFQEKRKELQHILTFLSTKGRD
ncbi:ABC transporter ATP-binding protein [Paenibacillus sp. S150]|uniref:ABC transporter ATP-binding protein n=1 Tax=Paenibacillus sp. S150 TaxID=2749826 RepID=UPI001C622622|nr:ABC transporter ATP-binding protein [Paenibacillus sp. S150]MBW4083097.1 ABC transporter ATP-binding protein [Paenibacillus sp. S150]